MPPAENPGSRPAARSGRSNTCPPRSRGCRWWPDTARRAPSRGKLPRRWESHSRSAFPPCAPESQSDRQTRRDRAPTPCSVAVSWPSSERASFQQFFAAVVANDQRAGPKDFRRQFRLAQQIVGRRSASPRARRRSRFAPSGLCANRFHAMVAGALQSPLR
jgi:hypothetical protein